MRLVRMVRMMRMMWMVGVRSGRVRMVGVRIVVMRIVAVGRVTVPWIVPVPWSVAVEEEPAVAGCAHAVRGAGGSFGVCVGGSGGGGLLGCAVLSHRAAQLEEKQQGP